MSGTRTGSFIGTEGTKIIPWLPLLGQLEQLPSLAARRVRNAALLTKRLSRIEGISPLPAQPSLTREAIYNYVFRYRCKEVSRDLFNLSNEELAARGLTQQDVSNYVARKLGVFVTEVDWRGRM